MIQILAIGVAVGLVVLGVKGFSPNGLRLTRNIWLKGTPGKVVGVCCILLGIAFVPLFLLLFVGYGWLLRQ